MSAYKEKDSSRFAEYVARMDAYSWKAYNAGPQLSSYCKRAAQRLFRLRSYHRMRRWFEQTLYTKDKNLGYVASFLRSGQPILRDAAVVIMGRSGQKQYALQFGQQLLKENRLPGRLALLKALERLGMRESIIFVKQRMEQNKGRIPFKERYALYRLLAALGGAQEARALRQQLSDLLRKKPLNQGLLRVLLLSLTRVGGAETLAYLTRGVKAGGALVPYIGIIVGGLRNMRRANPSRLLFSVAERTPRIDIYRRAIRSAANFARNHHFVFYRKAVLRYIKQGWPLRELVNALQRMSYNKVRSLLELMVSAPKLDFTSGALIGKLVVRNKDRRMALPFIKRVKTEKNIQLIAVFASALGDLKAKQALPILRKLTTTSAPGVRFVAKEAISKITGSTKPVILNR